MYSSGKGPVVPTIDLDQPHVPLAQFRVLYIGRAAPKATLESLDAIQKPLCELYTKDDRQSRDTDTDAVLTIYTSGLLMGPVNPLDSDLWLPIQTLQSCAAVKAVVDNLQQDCYMEKGQLYFAPIDDPKAAGSPYPAIFACVMGRSNGLPLTDCYAFICQSKDASLLMVQATMQAFSNKQGWACDRPPKRALVSTAAQCNDALENTTSCQYIDGTPAEFYERPPLRGFFYTPSAGLIQKFQIQGSEDCSTVETPLSGGGQLRTPYIPEQPNVIPQQSSVMPMVVYDTEQDAIFVDQDVTVNDWSPAFPNGGVVQFSEPGASQAIAFNPYLVPVIDPRDTAPVVAPQQPPSTGLPIIRQTTTTVGRDPVVKMTNWGRQDYGPRSRDPAATGRDPAVIVPVVETRVGNAPLPYGGQDPIYQKRLPRSNADIDQAYVNQSSGNGRGYTSGGGGGNYGPSSGVGQSPYGQAPAEDLYSHRLPPPTQGPLPQGARQFDSNFILQQSDTDKARIADIDNYRGYNAPVGISVADFGF